MNDLLHEVEKKIIVIRGVKAILDRDVAVLYQVETKRINEAVRNNPERFPEGYYFRLTEDEAVSLRSKISTLKKGGRGQHAKYLPNAFTEKGLYMIATVLKSERAVETTIAIIETFAKIREMTSNLSGVLNEENENERQSMIRRSGDIFSEVLSENLQVSDTETTIEVNFAMLKFKHTVKRRK